jgi:transglutaminase-like putative cysteine protease
VYFDIQPMPTVFYEVTDFYGNSVHYFSIQQSHKDLCVKVRSRVEVHKRPGLQLHLDHDRPWKEVVRMLSEFHEELVDVYHFKYESQHITIDDEIRMYAAQSFLPNRPLLEATNDLMQRIFRDFKFVPGYSVVATPLREIMRSKKGVCQDFAHLAIACVRSQGLAARYVSGYIETLPPPGKEKLVGTDASHAWYSVYLPGQGWFDFDPTNNTVPGEQHIVLAWGRDYSDVTPLKGVILGEGSHKLEVSVDVRRTTAPLLA